MGTNFTDIATIDAITAANINSRLEELGQAIDAGVSVTKIDIPVTAGENLTIRDVVYISTGAGAQTAGRAYKADADNAWQSSQAFIVGIMTEAVTIANTGNARIAGIIGGFTGLTIGKPQFVSATAGEVTETEPTNSWLAGIAISTTQILINMRGAQDTVATS